MLSSSISPKTLLTAREDQQNPANTCVWVSFWRFYLEERLMDYQNCCQIIIGWFLISESTYCFSSADSHNLFFTENDLVLKALETLY